MVPKFSDIAVAENRKAAAMFRALSPSDNPEAENRGGGTVTLTELTAPLNPEKAAVTGIVISNVGALPSARIGAGVSRSKVEIAPVRPAICTSGAGTTTEKAWNEESPTRAKTGAGTSMLIPTAPSIASTGAGATASRVRIVGGDIARIGAGITMFIPSDTIAKDGPGTVALSEAPPPISRSGMGVVAARLVTGPSSEKASPASA
jgi:hypothetical protein